VGTDAANRATRDAYDAVASDYARLLPDVTTEAPLDRAVLAAFVEMVKQSGDGLVAEVGCGSGRVTAHLADAALRIVGLDLSPGMATVARSARPDLAFAVAHAGALPLRSGTLGGLVAWYSLINLRTDLLPGVLAEFARVTRPGAPVVVAFQSGDGERVDRTTAYGHPVPLTYYRHRVEDVADSLAAAHLTLHATVRREPLRAHETTPQAFLLAQRR
jgi:ubiquinone/menaquinone biosynthesis C-methylase UbiE